MVFAQEVEHLLGLGGLGEGGVAAQIAEHDDDLAAMAFEDFLVALRDDQLGKLRREKPLQPPDPAQLLDLLGDPRFEPAVEFGDLLGALAQFAQQPRVLHRDHRLRREILQQRDLLVGKRPDLRPVEVDRPAHVPISSQRHVQRRARSTKINHSASQRVATPVGLSIF